MSPTAPSSPISIPSYRSWARRMVRLDPKPSFFAASCWSVLVVNGAAGFFLRSRRLTSVTWNVFRDLSASRMAFASASLLMTGFLPSRRWSFAVNCCPASSSRASTVQYSTGLNARISRSLSTSSRSATVCTRPAEIPFFTVFQSTGLALYPTRRSRTRRACCASTFRSSIWPAFAIKLHRVARDLVKENAPHWCTVFRLYLLRDMPRDGFTLAVRIGRQKYLARILRRALEIGDRLLLSRDGHVLRLEAVFDVDPHFLLGQIAHVTDRRAHFVGASEILPDRLRLRRRLDDH